MQIRGLLQDSRFIRALVVTGILTILFLISNIFVIGGDSFFEVSNTIISPIVALTTAALFFIARGVAKDHTSRSMWTGMGLGFGLYGLADVLWAYYALTSPEAVPYPSAADILWLLGYIPLYYALITRRISIKVKSSPRQRLAIAALSFAYLILTIVFLFRPIAEDFDPTGLWEGIFNIAYPLGDLGLIILASLVLILLRGGRFDFSWRLIFTGIIIMSISDLLYAIATWHDLYYPDGTVNGMTIIVDTTYSLAYICAGFGIYVYRLIWNIKDMIVLDIQSMPSASYYAFAATNRENNIISASNNFHRLINAQVDTTLEKMPLANVLGIAPDVMQALCEKMQHQEMLCNEPVTITTRDRQQREAWLTGVAFFDPDRGYSGANMAFTADIVVPDDQRMPRDEELRGMVNYLLSVAGSRPKDETQTMKLYFLEIVRLLSSLLYQYGGEPFRLALFDELERVKNREGLLIELTDQAISIPDKYDGPALANLLTPLLGAGQRFASEMVGGQVVREEITDLEKQLSPNALRDLDKYSLRAG